MRRDVRAARSACVVGWSRRRMRGCSKARAASRRRTCNWAWRSRWRTGWGRRGWSRRAYLRSRNGARSRRTGAVWRRKRRRRRGKRVMGDDRRRCRGSGLPIEPAVCSRAAVVGAKGRGSPLHLGPWLGAREASSWPTCSVAGLVRAKCLGDGQRGSATFVMLGSCEAVSTVGRG